METTYVSVMCANPLCQHFHKTRTVGMLHLGQGIYQHPTLVCECSPRMSMQMLPDDMQPHESPE